MSLSTHFGLMDSAREQLLFEAKNPRYRGVLSGAQIVERRANPSCGDVVTMYVLLDGQAIKDIRFEGQGCVISMAGASIVAERLIGKTIDEVNGLDLDTMREYLGLEIAPMRVSCATLGLDAMKRGITVWKTSLK